MPYFALGAGDTLVRHIVTDTNNWIGKAQKKKMLFTMGIPDPLSSDPRTPILELKLTVDFHTSFRAKANLMVWDKQNELIFNDVKDQHHNHFGAQDYKVYTWDHPWYPGYFAVICYLLDEEHYPQEYIFRSRYSCYLSATIIQGNKRTVKTKTVNLPQEDNDRVLDRAG